MTRVNGEANQYPNQYENVLGKPRFGTTEELPRGEALARMVSYFFNLANWEDQHRLLPSMIDRHVRDSPGVYMLWLTPPEIKPVESAVRLVRLDDETAQMVVFTRDTRLAYIGRSKCLKTRLSGYAMGVTPDRPPVYQVVRDRVMRKPQLAHDYLISPPPEMRASRRQWMKERGLSFQVAYTENPKAAHDLEQTMLRYCNRHDFVLWNTLLGRTGVTWPRPT